MENSNEWHRDSTGKWASIPCPETRRMTQYEWRRDSTGKWVSTPRPKTPMMTQKMTSSLPLTGCGDSEVSRFPSLLRCGRSTRILDPSSLFTGASPTPDFTACHSREERPMNIDIHAFSTGEEKEPASLDLHERILQIEEQLERVDDCDEYKALSELRDKLIEERARIIRRLLVDVHTTLNHKSRIRTHISLFDETAFLYEPTTPNEEVD